MKRLALAIPIAVLLWAQPTRPVDEFSTSAGTLQITPIRHASLMIEAGGQVIHVDPWSQGNYEGLPSADVILVTDTHGDHLDPAMITKLRNDSTMVIAPPAVAEKVPDATVLRNGDSKKIGDWHFEAVPMYNEKRGPAPGKLFHEKGRGNGYVITYGGIRTYIAGDTEGIPEMRELQDIDIAFVPMNLPYTMPPEEAAQAVKEFQPRVVYPYHYRGSDLDVFKNALAGTGIEVRLLDWYY